MGSLRETKGQAHVLPGKVQESIFKFSPHSQVLWGCQESDNMGQLLICFTEKWPCSLSSSHFPKWSQWECAWLWLRKWKGTWFLNLDLGHLVKIFWLNYLNPSIASKHQVEWERNKRTNKTSNNTNGWEISAINKRRGRENYLIIANFYKSFLYWLSADISFKSHQKGRVNRSIKSRERNFFDQTEHPVLSPKQTLKSQRVFSPLPLAKHRLFFLNVFKCLVGAKSAMNFSDIKNL